MKVLKWEVVKNLGLFFVLVLLLVIGLVLVRKNLSQTPSLTPTQEIERDLVPKLNLHNEAEFKFEVKKTSGNFARGTAGISPSGYSWIAIKEDGEWRAVWQAQDAPSCDEMSQFNIPQEIYEECY